MKNKVHNKKITFALAGNPNVGKSTVFNALTGLKQHTGNWTGKTVENACGYARYNNYECEIIDLPGCYSIMSLSDDERAARDFICFGSYDLIAVIADATALERNLNLLMQIRQITPNVILCINLMDEAQKKGISINAQQLSSFLGVEVITLCARNRRQTKKILDAVIKKYESAQEEKTLPFEFSPHIEKAIDIAQKGFDGFALPVPKRFAALKIICQETSFIDSLSDYLCQDINNNLALSQALDEACAYLHDFDIDNNNFVQTIAAQTVEFCDKAARQAVTLSNKDYKHTDNKIDSILTSKIFGIPIMLALLALVFFITIVLANYPSELLSRLFVFCEKQLLRLMEYIKIPAQIYNPLILGMFRTASWVVAVMLPPMAIFFPMFTLLEDLGYLPRIAFNLDRPFKKCGSCGKQSLCMCMGFGCNAAAVVGTRIIASKKERLIAITTNSLVPCNGRFPILIAMTSFMTASLAYSPIVRGIISALILTAFVLLGIIMSLLSTFVLSKTVLKTTPSSFILELPPYRRPQLIKTLSHSLINRTLFVLLRALAVAAPAGIVIYALANINIGTNSMLSYIVTFFEPVGRLMGMDGNILTAFILGLPANEIVLPLALMSYNLGNALTQVDAATIHNALLSNGFSMLTAINIMIFTLFHFPCATTILTIKKETKSVKFTLLSIVLPLFIGFMLCVLTAQILRFFVI